MSEPPNLELNSLSSFRLSSALEVQELCQRIYYLCKSKKAYAAQSPSPSADIEKYIAFLVKINLKFLKAGKTGQPPKVLLELRKTRKTIEECLSVNGRVFPYISNTLKDHLKLLLVELSRFELDYPLNLCFKNCKNREVMKRKTLKVNVGEIVKVPLNKTTTTFHPLPEFSLKSHAVKRLKRRNKRHRVLFLKCLPSQYYKYFNGLCCSIALESAETNKPIDVKVSQLEKHLPQWFQETYKRNYANFEKNCEHQPEPLLFKYQKRFKEGKKYKPSSDRIYNDCDPYVASAVSKTDREESVNEISSPNGKNVILASESPSRYNNNTIVDSQMNTEKKEGKIQENTLDTIQDNPVMERQSSDSSMKLTTDMDFKSQITSHSKNGSFSLLKQKNIPKENVTSSMRSLLNLNILNWSRNRLADGQSIAKHVSAMKRKAIHSSMPRPFMKNSDRKDISSHLTQNHQKGRNLKDLKPSYNFIRTQNKMTSNATKHLLRSPSGLSKNLTTVKPRIEFRKSKKKKLLLFPFNKDKTFDTKAKLPFKNFIHTRNDQPKESSTSKSKKLSLSANLSNKPLEVSLITKENKDQRTNKTMINYKKKISNLNSKALYHPLRLTHFSKASLNSSNIRMGQGMSPGSTNQKSSIQSQRNSINKNENARISITKSLFPHVSSTELSVKKLLNQSISDSSHYEKKYMDNYHKKIVKATPKSFAENLEFPTNSKGSILRSQTQQENVLEGDAVEHEALHSKDKYSHDVYQISVNEEQQAANNYHEITGRKQEFSYAPGYTIPLMERWKEAGLILVEVVSQSQFDFSPMDSEKRRIYNLNSNWNQAMVSQDPKSLALESNVSGLMKSISEHSIAQHSKGKQCINVNNIGYKFTDIRMSYKLVKDSFIFLLYPKLGFFMENYKRQSKPYFSNVDNILSSKEEENSIKYNSRIQLIEERSPVHGTDEPCEEPLRIVHRRFKRKKLRTIQNNTSKKSTALLAVKDNHKLASRYNFQDTKPERRKLLGSIKSHVDESLPKVVVRKKSNHEEVKSTPNVELLPSTSLKHRPERKKKTSGVLMKKKISRDALKSKAKQLKISDRSATSKKILKKDAANLIDNKKKLKDVSRIDTQATLPQHKENQVKESLKKKKNKKKRKNHSKKSTVDQHYFESTMVNHNDHAGSKFKKISANALNNLETLESLKENKTMSKDKIVLTRNLKTKAFSEENFKNRSMSYSNAMHQSDKSTAVYQEGDVSENERKALLNFYPSTFSDSQTLVKTDTKGNTQKSLLKTKSPSNTRIGAMRQKITSKKKVERQHSHSDVPMAFFSKLDVSKAVKIQHSNKINALVQHRDERNTVLKKDKGVSYPSTRQKILNMSTVSASLLPIQRKVKLKVSEINPHNNAKRRASQIRGKLDFSEGPTEEEILETKRYLYTPTTKQRSSFSFRDDASCFDTTRTNSSFNVDDIKENVSAECFFDSISTDVRKANQSKIGIQKRRMGRTNDPSRSQCESDMVSNKMLTVEGIDTKFNLRVPKTQRIIDSKKATNSTFNLTKTKNKNDLSQDNEPCSLFVDECFKGGRSYFMSPSPKTRSNKSLKRSYNRSTPNNLAYTEYDYKNQKATPMESEPEKYSGLRSARKHRESLSSESNLTQVRMKQRHSLIPFTDFDSSNSSYEKKILRDFTKPTRQTVVYGCLQDPSHMQPLSFQPYGSSTRPNNELEHTSYEKVSQGCEKQLFFKPCNKSKDIVLAKFPNFDFQEHDYLNENALNNSPKRLSHFDQKTIPVTNKFEKFNNIIRRSHTTPCVRVNLIMKNVIQQRQSNITRLEERSTENKQQKQFIEISSVTQINRGKRGYFSDSNLVYTDQPSYGIDISANRYEFTFPPVDYKKTVNLKKSIENKEFSEDEITSEVQLVKPEKSELFLKGKSLLSHTTSFSSTLDRKPSERLIRRKTYNFGAVQLKTPDTKKMVEKNSNSTKVTPWEFLRSAFKNKLKTFSKNSCQKHPISHLNKEAKKKFERQVSISDFGTQSAKNLIDTDSPQLDNVYSSNKLEGKETGQLNTKKVWGKNNPLVIKEVGPKVSIYRKSPVSDTAVCKSSESLKSPQESYSKRNSYDITNVPSSQFFLNNISLPDNSRTTSSHTSQSSKFSSDNEPQFKDLQKEESEISNTENLMELDGSKYCDVTSFKNPTSRLCAVPQTKETKDSFEFRKNNVNKFFSPEIETAKNSLKHRKISFEKIKKSTVVNKYPQNIVKKHLTNNVDSSEINDSNQMNEDETDGKKDINKSNCYNSNTVSYPVSYISLKSWTTDKLASKEDSQAEQLRLKLRLLKKKNCEINKSKTMPFNKISSMKTITLNKSPLFRSFHSNLPYSLNSFNHNTFNSDNAIGKKTEKRDADTHTILRSSYTKSAIETNQKMHSPNQTFYASLVTEPLEDIETSNMHEVFQFSKDSKLPDTRDTAEFLKSVDTIEKDKLSEVVNVTEVEQSAETVDATDVEEVPDVVDVTEAEYSPDVIDVTEEKQSAETVDVTRAEPLSEVVDVTTVEPLPDVNDVTAIKPLSEVVDVTAVKSLPEVVDVTRVEPLPDVDDLTAIKPLSEVVDVTAVKPLPEIVDVTTLEHLPGVVDGIMAEQVPNVVDVTKVEQVPDVVDVTEVKQVPDVVDVTEVEQVPDIVDVTEVEQVPDIVDVTEVEQVPDVVDVTEVEQVPDVIDVTEVEQVPDVVDVTEVEQVPDVVDVSEVEQVPGVVDVTEVKQVLKVVDVTEVEQSAQTVNATDVEQSTQPVKATEVEEVPDIIDERKVEQSVKKFDGTAVERLPEGVDVTDLEKSTTVDNVSEVEQVPDVVDVTEVEQSAQTVSATDVEQSKQAVKANEVEQVPDIIDERKVEQSVKKLDGTAVERLPEGVDVTGLEKSTTVDNVSEVEQVPDVVDVTEVEQSAQTVNAPDVEQSTQALKTTEVVQVPDTIDERKVEQSVKEFNGTAVERLPEGVDVTDLEKSTTVDNVSEVEQVPDVVDVTEVEQSAQKINATDVEQSTQAVKATEVEQSTQAVKATEVEQVPDIIDERKVEQSVKKFNGTAVERLPEGVDVTDLEKSTTVDNVSEVEQVPDVVNVKEVEQAVEAVNVTEVEALPEVLDVTAVEPLPEVDDVIAVEPLPEVDDVIAVEPLPEVDDITAIKPISDVVDVKEVQQSVEAVEAIEVEHEPGVVDVKEVEQSAEAVDVTNVE